MIDPKAMEAAREIVNEAKYAARPLGAFELRALQVARALLAGEGPVLPSGEGNSVAAGDIIEGAINAVCRWVANEHQGDIDLLSLTRAIRASSPSPAVRDVTLRETLKLALPYVEAVAKRVDRSPKVLRALKDMIAIRSALSPLSPPERGKP